MYELLQVQERIVAGASEQQIADLLGRSLAEVADLVATLSRKPNLKSVLKEQRLLKMQDEARERNVKKQQAIPVAVKIPEKKKPKVLPDFPSLPSPVKIKPTIRKPRKRKKAMDKELEKTRRDQVREERKKQRELQIMREVEKSRQQQNKKYKTKDQQYGQMTMVRIDKKTVIYIRPDQDPEQAIRNYNAVESQNEIRTKIKYSGF